MTPTAWRPLGAFGPPPGEWQGGPLVLHLYAVTAREGTPHNREACGLDLAHPSHPARFRRVATPPA